MTSFYRQFDEGPLTHRRHTRDIPHDYALLFAADPRRNEHYGPHVWTLKTELPEVHEGVVELAMDYFGVGEEEALELVDPPDIVNDAGVWEDMQFNYAVWERFEEPGYRTYDGAVVLDREGVELEYHYDKQERIAASPQWYFRLSSIGNKLPTTWSYTEEAEAEPGFQVWLSTAHVLSAILGFDLDGEYSPQEGYDRLILVKAEKTSDSPSYWSVVKPEDVIETRAVDTLPLQTALETKLERKFGEDWWYEAEEYLEDNEETLEQWLLQQSSPVQVGFIDTLG